MAPSALDALDYALPENGTTRRDRVVRWIVVVGALILGVQGCLVLLGTGYVLHTQPAVFNDIDGWGIAHLISLIQVPMLIACAVLGLRWSPSRAAPGRFVLACTITLGVILLYKVPSDVHHWRLPLRAVDGDAPFYRATLHLVTYAHLSFLSMPLLLLRAPHAHAWRRRALGLAALTTFLSGLGGTYVLRYKAERAQNITGGTFAEAVQATLRDPMPIIGLWPVAGLAAAALFVISISRPRVQVIVFAVVLAVIFKLNYAWFDFRPLVGASSAVLDRLVRTLTAIEAGKLIICDLLPVALVAWVLKRDREHLLGEPVPKLANWAETPS